MTPGDIARRRLLLGLTGLTCLAAATAGVVGWVHTNPRGRLDKSGPLFPRLGHELTSLSQIEIIWRGGGLVMRKTNTGWVAASRDSFPINEAPLAQLITSLKALRYRRALTMPAEAQTPPLAPALGGDGIQLILRRSDGVLIDLTLAQRGGLMLAQIGADPQLYQVSGPTWPDLGTPQTWLALDGFEIAPERIATASLTRLDQPALDIVRRPDGGFAPVGGKASPAATDVALLMARFAPVDVMAARRLSGPARLRHQTQLKSGLLITLEAYVSQGQLWAVFRVDPRQAATDQEARSLQAKTHGWAFALTSAQASLLETPTALILSAGATPAASD